MKLSELVCVGMLIVLLSGLTATTIALPLRVQKIIGPVFVSLGIFRFATAGRDAMRLYVQRNQPNSSGIKAWLWRESTLRQLRLLQYAIAVTVIIVGAQMICG
jgi:hypothetical protein